MGAHADPAHARLRRLRGRLVKASGTWVVSRTRALALGHAAQMLERRCVVEPLRCCFPALLIWGAPPSAMAADALPIKLGWTAPPECGDAQTVERDVQSMLGETSIPASRP